MTKYSFAFFFTLLISQACFSQFSEQRIWPVLSESGQSPGATFAIVEDRQGFIWFGTLGGLVRYDGYGFKTFKYNDEDENSLSNNLIRALYADKDGFLWIGTQGGGLNRFDPEMETFTHFKFEQDNIHSLSSNEVWAITEDNEGYLWVGTWGGGLNRLDKETGIFTVVELSPGNSRVTEDGIRSLLVRDNRLWVGMHTTGLFRLDLADASVTPFQHEPQRAGSIPSNEIYNLFADKDNHLWVCTFYGGLALFDDKTERFQSFMHNPRNANSPAGNLIYHIMQARSGELWMAHDRAGITIFDYQNNIFRNLGQDKCRGNSLSSDRVRYLFQDSNGIIWIATENGVDKIVENKKFVSYRYQPESEYSLNTRVVRSVFEDHNGLLWIGAFDAPTTVWDPHRERFIRQGGIIEKVGWNAITSIVQDDQNHYWVGTSQGLLVFDERQRLLRSYFHNPQSGNSISDNIIQSIRKGNGIEWWIGTENGLNRLDMPSGKWTNFLYDAQNPHSIGGNKIQSSALIVQPDGVVWAGTWGGGLNKYLPAEDRFVRYQYHEDNPQGINNNNVLSLYLDGDILWAGTFGGGLNRMDIKQETFDAITEIDGLPNNIIYGILPDKTGRLWLATDNGLVRYDPGSGEILVFDTGDGLPSGQFFWGASYANAAGEMFFGTTDGLISFLPENISLNTRMPTITLTDVKVFNESLRFDKSVAYINRLQFRHDVPGFQIEFTTLDYTVPQKNRFAYRLEGRDDSWIYIGNRNFINFTNMAPGHYTLTIIGSNNDGLWDMEGKTIRITIHPPFWQTLWFRALLIILVLVGFVVFYKLRTFRVKKQKRALESLVGRRTAELAGANEELRSANEELHNQREELATANEELYSQREELETTLNKLQSTQSQLVHSEKMASLGVLAAGVAHEINNPLNFIHGGVIAIDDFIQDHHKDIYPEINPLLDIVYTGVKRASGIVSSLNHYSRKDDMQKADCDVHTLIDSCLRMIEGHIKGHISVVKDYTEPNAVICCNEGKIHQAILNILTNAMHAIPGKGEIHIRTRFENDRLSIVVADNGEGIAADVLPRITDPFFTTKDPGKGTGLGLSITLNIIDEHNGQLHFASEVGQGTQVRILLPR